MTKDTPPWMRKRDAEELERERKHLEMMRKFERDALLVGTQIRLKKPKDKP